jgi:dihydroorotase
MGALTQGLQGDQLAEIHALLEAGCVALTQLRHPMQSTQTQLKCLEYASTFGALVVFQSEIPSLSPLGGIHQGKASCHLGLPEIPCIAETIALQRDLSLVEQTGVRAHFNQISCGKSVQILAEAKDKGLPVTADVSLQQLYFTEDDCLHFDPLFHIKPPFRTDDDRAALLRGLKDGTIDAICSAHCPLPESAKAAPFAESQTGISALATFLPMSYQLVQKGVLTIDQWLDTIALNPAKILQLNHGEIKQGQVADLCIFDPSKRWELTPDKMHSKALNSPFLNKWISGSVQYMIKSGTLVYHNQD